jgi:protein-disulfide isomerase
MRKQLIALPVCLVAFVGALMAAPGNAAHADTTVAKAGDRTITQSEVEKKIRARLIQLEQERFEAMREGIEAIIADSLLEQEAKAKGQTLDALLKAEVTDKTPEPSDTEIQELYDLNKEQLENAPLESVKPRLVDYLKQLKGVERRQQYVATLKEKYPTTISLSPPIIAVSTGGRPSRGGAANAAVTMIEFSDYECPYCQSAEATVGELLKEYGDKIHFVYRDYPLPFHPNAKRASLAAHCAQAQGKFWDYHDKLFIRRQLEADKLKSLAGELGLDQKQFDECLDKEQFKDAVDKDMADGANAGVTGTPTFFVNGRSMPGADIEDLKKVIDEELARTKQTKS